MTGDQDENAHLKDLIWRSFLEFWTHSGFKQTSTVSRLPHGTVIHSYPFLFFCRVTRFSFYLLKGKKQESINPTTLLCMCSVYPRELFDILEIVKIMSIFDPVMKFWKNVDIKNKQPQLMILALILQSAVLHVLDAEFGCINSFVALFCSHLYQNWRIL